MKGVQIMKKLLLFTLALVSGISAWAGTTVTVTNESDFKTNIKDNNVEKVILGADLTLTVSSVTPNNSGNDNYATDYAITRTNKLTIDFNGHNINVNQPSGGCYFITTWGNTQIDFVNTGDKNYDLSGSKQPKGLFRGAANSLEGGYCYWGLIVSWGN